MNEQLHYPASPERRITDGLDMYKLYMGQIALENYPDTEVTFTLKNRAETPLSTYVDIEKLTARFDEIRSQGFTTEEITYLAGLEAQDGNAFFTEEYLEYLAHLELGEVQIGLNEGTGDIEVATSGQWANVSLWETIVMSEVNQQYYENYVASNELSVDELWAEGDRRLDEKIAKLASRPDVKFADFGTRRRFSAKWHDHVVGRLAKELPDTFIGTSNPWLAYKHDITPIGTYAHEMPMVYAALADAEGKNPLDGHSKMTHEWEDRYGEPLSTALPDTFTSEFFFADFTKDQAEAWRGLRHDSGDPVEFGERAISFYEEYDIDPREKTIVFSDGLDIDTIIMLADHFKGRVNVLFGWGTSLMNDLGVKANNFVMKVTEVNGIDTVKLSDNAGKHTGPPKQVKRYMTLVEERLTVPA
jgi:nicotinate phosphoribosyltransferase